MPIGMGSSFAQNILNTLFTGVAWPTAPAGVYVQFHLGDPGVSGTNNPAVNTNRYHITSWGTAANSGAYAVIANSGSFGLGTVSTTETYNYWSAWTAGSGGTLICTGTVAGGSVTSGSSPTIPSGALTARILVAST